MRQLVQSVRNGKLAIIEAPDPLIGPTEVLVRTTHSVVSAGTERAVRELASASLFEKAKARPDLVRQVIRKAREDGIRATANAVRARLDDDMPLGYSGSGVVLEVGEAVAGIRPGMRVATGGAGHGDLQVVAGLLTRPVPDGVTNEQAAFATVASIALHGLRLANVGPGGSVCVVGLGLIGQLTVRLALASGLRVYGVDLREWTVERAVSAGASASVEHGEDTTRAIQGWSRGHGVDAVLLTAATSSSDPVLLAPSRLRDRGTIVVVGDVGLDLKRTPLYEKEISLKVARSYGPGRYERAYEEWGVDYPVGQVRFTEGRNQESVMDLMAMGRLQADELITHRFAFEKSADAYALMDDRESRYLGIQLSYAEVREAPRPPNRRRTSTKHSVSLIGAGTFAKGVLIPALQQADLGELATVSSASGVSASRVAARLGADAVSVEHAIENSDSDIVVIATSHDSHAGLVVRALGAGKHVFCEKPLALTMAELDEVATAWSDSGCQLAVGFNRRHASDIVRARTLFAQSGSPLVITYRVNAGELPPDHWFNDRRQGGRLIGEGCHFVDTCAAIVDRPIVEAMAVGDSRPEVLLSNNFTAMLGFDDGSTASIGYASSAHRSTPKERIEVHGQGHSLVIDDFRSITIDGKVDEHRQDKGHAAQFERFKESIKSGDTSSSVGVIESMRATLRAAASVNRAQ